MSIKSVFDKYSAEYDGARRRLIPCFDDLYKTALNTIPFAKEEKIKVLDLGAGTGLLSEMIASGYPYAELTLMDISGKMLAIAKTRLKRFPNPIDYREEDYGQEQISDRYDLIISSLSIHHLAAEDKKKLFANCFAALTLGGIFINADQVLGEDAAIEKIYRANWLEEVVKNGVSEEELAAAFERMKEDKMSTLSYQLSALAEVGFSDTTCCYENYSFVVFSGRKIEY